ATDRFFGGRRAPVIAILLVALGSLTLVYSVAVDRGLGVSVFLLALIGFAIYGPQVLLVGTAPVDLARKGTAAAAVGFVNFMGYMGAFAGDVVTGNLVEHRGWQAGLYFWSGCAFAAAVVSALLWNKTGKPDNPTP
ncbi:MAG: MFS transporter, partial [Verrucomicrobiales bacterium]